MLVLQSLWGALGFEHLPAWGVLAREGVSVLVLWVGVPWQGVVLLSSSFELGACSSSLALRFP